MRRFLDGVDIDSPHKPVVKRFLGGVVRALDVGFTP